MCRPGDSCVIDTLNIKSCVMGHRFSVESVIITCGVL